MLFLRISLMLSLSIALQARADDKGWRKVTSEEGGFSVSVPGKVERKVVSQPADDGPGQLRAIVAGSDGLTYVAAASAMPGRIAEGTHPAFFDRIRETHTTAAGATLQSEERGNFQGVPMYDLRITSNDPAGKPRVCRSRFLVGDPTRVYVLQVFGPVGGDFEDDSNRFFESFRRVEPGASNATTGQANSSPGEKGEPAKPAVKAIWRPYTPPGKGFSFLMPGEPTHTTDRHVESGVTWDQYAVELGDRGYLAACYELHREVAKEDLGATLERACQSGVKAVKGTVVSIKAVQVGGIEGREVLFDRTGPYGRAPALGRSRAFVVGSRACVLLYAGAKGTSEGEEVQNFLDSFRVAKSPAPAKPQAGAAPR